LDPIGGDIGGGSAILGWSVWPREGAVLRESCELDTRMIGYGGESHRETSRLI
jgi:hypothetical protein